MDFTESFKSPREAALEAENERLLDRIATLEAEVNSYRTNYQSAISRMAQAQQLLRT